MGPFPMVHTRQILMHSTMPRTLAVVDMTGVEVDTDTVRTLVDHHL